MRKSITTYLLYSLCGALCAIPYVFQKLWLFSWVFFVPILVFEYINEKEHKHPYWNAWKRGFSFFYAYGLVLFYWFVELYPLDFAGFTPLAALAVVVLAWFGLPALQAAVSAFVIVFLCFFRKKLTKPFLYPLLAACLWVISEWAHTLTWLGLPWGRLAIGQIGKLANIQSASLFGSYFVAFIIVLCAGYLAMSVVCFNKTDTKKAIAFFSVAVIIFSANSIYGNIMLNKTSDSEKTTAAAIQGNFSTDEKWDEETDDTFEVHKTLTLDAALEGASLIVWSETALPYRINIVKWIEDYAEGLASKADAELIIGCFESSGDDFCNITKFVSSDGEMCEKSYSKRKLVPFGEYVPLRKLITAVFPFLEDISLLEIDLTAGDDSNLFETENGMIGSLICFDSVYENIARNSVLDGAELLCISTNDSWFGASSALYQHNAQAILRSVENGRYTVRAANTGVSTIISNRGEILDMMPPNTKGYAIGEVEFISENTLYTNIGNILVYISIAFIIVLFAFYTVKDKFNGHFNRQRK